MKRIQQEQKQQNKQKITRFSILIGLAILIVLVAEIWLANRVSSYGDKIAELKQAESSLQLENEVLESQIAEKSSLNRVSKEAQALGFSSMSNIQYLQSDSLASAR